MAIDQPLETYHLLCDVLGSKTECHACISFSWSFVVYNSQKIHNNRGFESCRNNITNTTPEKYRVVSKHSLWAGEKCIYVLDVAQRNTNTMTVSATTMLIINLPGVCCSRLRKLKLSGSTLTKRARAPIHLMPIGGSIIHGVGQRRIHTHERKQIKYTFEEQ